MYIIQGACLLFIAIGNKVNAFFGQKNSFIKPNFFYLKILYVVCIDYRKKGKYANL